MGIWVNTSGEMKVVEIGDPKWILFYYYTDFSFLFYILF